MTQTHSPHPIHTLPFYRTLYFRVIVGIIAGVVVGLVSPHFAAALKPLGDIFVKLVRMIIAPVIFLCVVVGIANMGNTHKLGRVGLKALVYFEVVTVFALLIGLGIALLFQPGKGMNVNPTVLDPTVAQYAAEGRHLTALDFISNIVPDTFAGAFSKGEILQVLLLAILCGLALVALDKEGGVIRLAESLSRMFFKIVAYIMEAAPIGAFGAMAFTIGRFGVHTLLSLGKLLMCVYLTCFGFIGLVLGLICLSQGVNFWKFLKYIREEIVIALGTSSSESVLPRLMVKMERLGCSKSIVGLVIPAGYSFNLDGTCIYLTLAALFIAQATNTRLTLGQTMFVLLILMLNSKGAAAVTGGGFITLAATLSSIGTIPVAGIGLLLGVDRFMSEVRTITNLIGNGVAAIVIARWEKEFDAAQATRELNGDFAGEQSNVAEEGSMVA